MNPVAAAVVRYLFLASVPGLTNISWLEAVVLGVGLVTFGFCFSNLYATHRESRQAFLAKNPRERAAQLTVAGSTTFGEWLRIGINVGVMWFAVRAVLRPPNPNVEVTASALAGLGIYLFIVIALLLKSANDFMLRLRLRRIFRD